MTATPVPPLPDMLEVLDASKWVDCNPDLRQYARRWIAWAPGGRERVAEEAAMLARPSLRVKSLRAVGRSGVQASRASAPTVAARARARRRGELLDSEETRTAVKIVQDVVKAGGPTYVGWLGRRVGRLGTPQRRDRGWWGTSVPRSTATPVDHEFATLWEALGARFGREGCPDVSAAELSPTRLSDPAEEPVWAPTLPSLATGTATAAANRGANSLGGTSDGFRGRRVGSWKACPH